MERISFEGIGEVMATFEAEENVKAGQVVKVSGNGTAAPCAAGDRPAGVAAAVKNGCAAVQVRGFATVSATGVGIGWAKLSADGSGGMAADENGADYLVVQADGEGTTVVLL